MKTTVLFLLLLFSSWIRRDENEKKVFSVGNFSFEFPANYKKKAKKYKDAEFAWIEQEHILFSCDYGYYPSPVLSSPQEFFEQDKWKWNSLAKLNVLSTEKNVTDLLKKIKLLKSVTTDSIEYTNIYLFNNDTLKYPIKLPKEIRDNYFEMDTLEGVFYKRIKGIDFVQFYAKELNNYNPALKANKTLTITIEKLNKREIERVWTILNSCKYTP